MKARKILIFRTTLGHFLKKSMSLAQCQNNPIDVNFHLKKVWKVLIKDKLTKSDSKMTRRLKYRPSCQLGLTRIQYYKNN